MILPNSFSGKGITNKSNGCGQAPSIQTIGTLPRTPWLENPAGKMDSTKSRFDKPLYYPKIDESVLKKKKHFSGIINSVCIVIN